MKLPDSKTVYVSGKIYWAKIIGEKALVPNYDQDGREWAYEFEPDDSSFLKEVKLLDRLKNREDAKNPDKGDYLYLRRPEFTKDGEKNDPIRIYNDEGGAWDDRLLGNGTEVDVKLRIVDYGKGKKSGIYTTAIRVTKLVPFISNEFGAMDTKTKPKAEKPKAENPKAENPKAEKPKTKTVLEDLDDEIPF